MARHATRPEPDSDELERMGFALSAWGGKFRINCGRCYAQARCDIRNGEYLNPEAPARSDIVLPAGMAVD